MTEQGEYIQKGSTIKVVKYQAGQLYVLEEKGKELLMMFDVPLI